VNELKILYINETHVMFNKNKQQDNALNMMKELKLHPILESWPTRNSNPQSSGQVPVSHHFA